MAERHRSNKITAVKQDSTCSYPYRSEEHTSELQSQSNLVCRLLLEKKKENHIAPLLRQAEVVGDHDALAARALGARGGSRNLRSLRMQVGESCRAFRHDVTDHALPC